MFKNIRFTKLQIGLIILALFSFYFWSQTSAPVSNSADSGAKEFNIVRGDNFLEIAQNLKMSGLIKSRAAFALASLVRGSFNKLKAGQYVFDPGLNLLNILKKIEKGDVIFGSDEVAVTIPEGLNIAGIAEKLEEAGFKDADKIEKMKASGFVDKFPWLNLVSSRYNNLEGFLFPDTYRFSKDAGITEVVEKMLGQFAAKTEDLRSREVLAGKNFYDVLIMASILEKEVPPADMFLVSGILWKRMEIDMPLQVDASLAYDLARPIRREDIDTLDSEFNTYKSKGLPPTPISNPGLSAIRAALYPQSSDYLYYLSRSSDKATIFSRTFEEHNLARSKYLR